MQIKIRNVKPEDLEAVTKIEALCFPAAEAGDKESFTWRIQTYPESFFVAEDGDTMIGFINGCVTDSSILQDELYHNPQLHKPDGAYQTVFGLDVIPEYRCKGIAAQLMNHLIQTAKAAGRKGMILTCKEHLIHYYEKFGYQNQGASDSTHGGAQWYDMLLTF